MPGTAVLPIQAEPGAEPGIGQGALQRRIAADQLDLVEQDAPAGIAGSAEQQRHEAGELPGQLRGGHRLERKHPAGPGRDQRLADGWDAHFGAGPQPRDAAQRLRVGRSPAQQKQAGGEDRRETGIRRADRDLQRLQSLGPLAQRGDAGGDRVIRPVRQCRIAQCGGQHMPGMRQRGLLADDDPADHEALLARDLGQIAEQMRLAGAEAASHTDPGGRPGARRTASAQAAASAASKACSIPVCSVPIWRMAARLGTPARSASIAVRASSIMREPHQRRHRILPVAGPHIRPHPHLQRRVLAQRAARIAGGQRRVGQHRHEQARQVLGVVDDLPQHLIGVHHRGRRIAQHAVRGRGA